MKKNVLVFPCGSEIGLEIHRSLSLSTHFKLLGGSSAPDHGEFVYNNYIEDVPFVDDPDFVTKLNNITDAHKIDFIFPAHDSVVLKLAQAQAEGTLHCKVITSDFDTCDIARSKSKTYKFFDGLIPTPKIYAEAGGLQESEFPVFLKPDVGQGSKGTYLAKTHEDIAFYMRKDPTLLILEYLPGKEYTIDCFTDRKGQLQFAEGRERKRVSNGISVNSTTAKNPLFRELAEKINEKLSFRGAWFFQVKESAQGELVLMEVAPRIAGTMGLVRCKGVNLGLLSLFDALDYDVDTFENNHTLTIDRALENRYRHDIDYKHVYIDFDDLVIFEGQVNPAIMAFVYQCMNKKIKTHLITKHSEDLDKNLIRYRLKDVFDEVIWIKNGEEKHTYIKEKNAIFIDDSFAERKSISDKCHIPTFDSHMLESLMEKF